MLYNRPEHALRRCSNGDRFRRSLLCRCLSLGDARTSLSVDPRLHICKPSRPWCRLGFFLPLCAILFCTSLFCTGLFCASDGWADEPLSLNGPQQQPNAVSTSPFGHSILVKPVAPNQTAAEKAAVPNVPATHMPAYAISEAQARSSVQWLAEFAIKQTPRTYNGDKDWGDTKKVWSGLKVRREGLQIRTKRRRKEVNHGRWIKYELKLPERTPNKPDPILATIHHVKKVGDLRTGVSQDQQANTHWKIESSVETPVNFTARIQRWNLGVKLYSISVEGKMKVRLDSTTTLSFLADYTEVPPALVINPAVQASELHLREFEVDRISKIGGDAAEKWGELLEKVVRDVFLKKQNEKLTGKLNKAIDKHRDDLRLSMSDWFSNW